MIIARITEFKEDLPMNDVYKRKHGVSRKNRDKCTNTNIVIPIWEKYTLTIEEAAKYSNISSKTLRRFINECTPDFILKIGTKTLIKRKVFEKFLEKTDAI